MSVKTKKNPIINEKLKITQNIYNKFIKYIIKIKLAYTPLTVKGYKEMNINNVQLWQWRIKCFKISLGIWNKKNYRSNMFIKERDK